MAENESVTPEKQLLKLIENPRQETLRVGSVKREGKKWFSLGAFKGRFAFWKTFASKKWFSLRGLTKSSFGIRQVNFVLRLVLLFLGLSMGYSIVMMGLELKKASNLILKPDKGVSAPREEGIELRNLSYYLEKISARNVFQAGEIPKKEEAPAKPEPAEEHDYTKDFSLVGIAWSADPEAMIENTVQKRTYFVRRGQSLDNSVKVVTIFKDRVILNYEGKEFELR